MTAKPWSGRFDKDTDRLVEAYTASIHFDSRLYSQDIRGSIAHARMLGRQGIIAESEAAAIAGGLESIRNDIESGHFQFKPELEDIHMNIESALTERIGSVAGKLHTARSRNDQVALDLRLYSMEVMDGTVGLLRGLQEALLRVGEANIGVAMPGYTHLQRAQPVLLAHHLLAYFHMLQRDKERFHDCRRRTDVMPLGSGALAGAPYPLDRESVARELGFSRISPNSLDAVSDRDFVVEYLAAASICMMHLSRLSEELVLWSTEEFGFIEMDDAFATGSSIMPQKKNPDVAELARGKTGRVYGRLLGMLTVLKGLPLSYNRDLQEDKEAFFDVVDTLLSTLEVFAPMLASLRFKTESLNAAAGAGYILATDLADFLAKKGLPFREAHHAVGQLVGYALGSGKLLSDLTLEEYRRFSPHFDQGVFAITVGSSLAARDVPGGTAPVRVGEALEQAKALLTG
ncbi:MAG: argininosuccinate lyase [Dehalococcoidia bacterium]|nr:argininosuccinate lyase [Dehalococcoidia bacterium]